MVSLRYIPHLDEMLNRGTLLLIATVLCVIIIVKQNKIYFLYVIVTCDIIKTRRA